MSDPLALTLTYEEAKDWLARGELLTAEDAGMMFGVQPVTIRAWVKREWLVPFFGQSWPRLYRRSDVERCVEEWESNRKRGRAAS